MKHSRSLYFILLAVISMGVWRADAQENFAEQAYNIFAQNCLNCHGEHGAFTEEIVIDHKALIESGAVVPGKPDASELYTRLFVRDAAKRMPLGQPQLSFTEILTIGNWIQTGAANWEVSHDVNFITPNVMLTAMQTHLSTLNVFDRRFARYFTMTHLYNAGESREVLNAYKIALSKLVNSLSWGYEVSNPVPIDAAETIFYIDLRDYEWDIRGDAWTEIETVYPYSIEYDPQKEAGLLSQLTALRQEMSCQVPFVYADWFLAMASLPPLYHDILDLPSTDSELERQLEVNVARNIQSAPGRRVWRAGFNGSGVSNNNRVVERHTSRYGAYWKSYDFAGSVGVQNIFTHPLSFQPDGGEIVFNLPNGLQAYLIVDSAGNRIDVAPTEIVSNPAASDPAVHNGLSCIGCHTEGMKTFTDAVRGVISAQVNPPFDKAQALRLYAPKADMDALVGEDTERFRQALLKTGGVFGGIEPVHRFYEAFMGPIDAQHAAAAIGLEPEAFLRQIREKQSLQDLGLLALAATNGNIKRDTWTQEFQNIITAVNAEDTLATDRSRTTPLATHGTFFIPDTALRDVVAETLSKTPGTPITESDMARLTQIHADEKGIRDLTGLEAAVNLERIEMRGNQISDLTPLAGLIRLNNIKLRGNAIRDVSPLAGLINVDWLGLEENVIEDLSPLKGLVKLNGIGLEGNPVSDISPLASLISLEGIGAQWTPIRDFSALAKLPRLQWIELANLSKMPSLIGLRRLRRLVITDGNLSDISAVAELTQLTELNLERNAISNIAPLAKLKNLKRLYLNGNIISDVSALASLTALEALELHDNTISDVSPLAKLTRLERLNLANNAISDVSVLKGLSEKTHINFAGNTGLFKAAGPKITGPWLWLPLPGTQFQDFRQTDMLARLSGGQTTEKSVSTHGATPGAKVGEAVWISQKIAPNGGNNLRRFIKDEGESMIYGSIAFNAPRQQKTYMFAGSDDRHKVWLNGELVRDSNEQNWSEDYKELFRVTLKAGRNVLLVAVYDWGGGFCGHFGFARDAEYSLTLPGTHFAFSTNTQQVAVGESFILHFTVDKATDLAGYQTDLTFDPKRINATSIAAGTFLKQSSNSYFQKGRINNKTGEITGIKQARVNAGVNGKGTLLLVKFNTIAPGAVKIKMRNFQAGTHKGQTIPAFPPEIRIHVGTPSAAPSLPRPEETALLTNYPNPFNPETWIPYQLAEASEVSIHIYDVKGLLVRTLALGHQPAGYYIGHGRTAYWDGRNRVGELVASGVYFYTLNASDFVATRRMLILK